MKRGKIVRDGGRSAMRVTTGRTRAIQGVCHGVSSAKIFCMSTQTWAVWSVRGPEGNAFHGALSQRCWPSTVLTILVTDASLNGLRRNAAYIPGAASATALSGSELMTTAGTLR